MLSAPAARAQESQGPITPPPKFEVRRVSSQPAPPPPPLPAEEIIRRFTANEETIEKAYNTYSSTQTTRLQELVDGGGEFTVTGEQYEKPDGARYERIVKPPQSTLKLTAFSLQDVRQIASLPLFFLTPGELEHYYLTYEGKEQLDQVSTYIFGVKPKQLERQRRYFEGVVWVDDQDFAIVKSSGRFVSEIAEEGEKFPFTMFDIYRENIAGKLWFPAYISSDDYIPQAGGKELHLHLVVRSTDFKPQTSPRPALLPKPPQP